MPQLTLNLTVEASPEEVFRVFSDFRHAADLVSGITKIEILTDGPIGTGTRFLETRLMFNKEATEEMEITAMEPNKSYTLGCDSCGCTYSSTFRFTPNGNGTNVEFHMDARPISLFAKIMSPVTALMFGPMMRKCMTKDMAELKAAVEGSPKTMPSPAA